MADLLHIHAGNEHFSIDVAGLTYQEVCNVKDVFLTLVLSDEVPAKDAVSAIQLAVKDMLDAKSAFI